MTIKTDTYQDTDAGIMVQKVYSVCTESESLRKFFQCNKLPNSTILCHMRTIWSRLSHIKLQNFGHFWKIRTRLVSQYLWCVSRGCNTIIVSISQC